MRTFLFVSTNGMWSGSEELWTRAAKQLYREGHRVFFMAPYAHHHLDILPVARVPFPFHPTSPWQRIATRTGIVDHSQDKLFLRVLSRTSPDLVVISQGDNVSSWPLMGVCGSAGIPYATITQLVAEVHMLGISPANVDMLRAAYAGAARNYFVSDANRKLNDLMLGHALGNAEVVYNPCKVREDIVTPWPSVSEGYKLAVVGRIEFFHKGLDLLLECASQGHWRNRPIIFQVYGAGPHAIIMQSVIGERKLNNINMMGTADVMQIWSHNHALLMPSRMEGMSLSLIEAMWCKRLPIVTAVGGAPELVYDGVNGFVADAPTVGSLNAALERAWESRDKWQSMAERAAVTLTEKHPKDEVDYFCKKIFELIPA
jgi:glycosyltransferase involved in cell wall biosynthesis